MIKAVICFVLAALALVSHCSKYTPDNSQDDLLFGMFLIAGIYFV